MVVGGSNLARDTSSLPLVDRSCLGISNTLAVVNFELNLESSPGSGKSNVSEELDVSADGSNRGACNWDVSWVDVTTMDRT